jgi:hypothetical protein
MRVPDNTVVWTGFLEDDGRSDTVRIYLALDKREWVDIPRDNVVEQMKIGDDKANLVSVWVQPEANTAYHVEIDKKRGFLEGALTSEHLANVVAGNPFATAEGMIARGGVVTAFTMCVSCPRGSRGPC